jgi:hypothetical protein
MRIRLVSRKMIVRVAKAPVENMSHRQSVRQRMGYHRGAREWGKRTGLHDWESRLHLDLRKAVCPAVPTFLPA